MIQLRVIQTTPKLILEWDPVPGATAGYRGKAEGVEKWTQTQQTRMTFAANATGIVIQALGVEDEGHHPPTTPPPPSAKNGVSFMRWSDGEPPPSHLTDFDTWMTSLGGLGRGAGQSAAKRVLTYLSAVTCSYNWANVVEAAECRSKGWVMKAADGSELTNVQYGGSAAPLADPGNVDYQKAWAERAVARCQQYGIEGIFVDDCLRTPSLLSGGKMAAKYPTWQQYEAAQVAWAAYCGKYLRDRGFYIMLNAGDYVPGYAPSNDGGSAIEMWTKYAPHVDGLNAEYWMWRDNFPQGPDIRRVGPGWHQSWDGWQRLPALCESLGVDFYNMSYATNAAHRDYSLCCTLLDTRGSFVLCPRNVSDEWWTPMCSKAIALGNATAAKVKNGNRWQRQYQNGLVWVDPVAGTSGIS